METFSALLALCEGNPPVTGGFPSQRPVTRNFDAFFDLRPNKRLSKQSRRRWFETPSRSSVRYCNSFFDVVWGSTYVSNLQKLVILQKRIIRMIMGAKPRDHTGPMFLKLGLLKFVDINKYLIAVFMHRNHIARTPDVFIDYFKRIQDVHHYATRSCSGLYAMQVKTDLGKTSISYIGPIIWNKILSVGINPDTSECVFSKSLKTCIKTNLF